MFVCTLYAVFTQYGNLADLPSLRLSPTQDKDWTIGASLKGRIDTFERTMPLIQDLKNPAMRERHWEQLKEEVQQPFDHTSDDFTLEKIMELGLDQYYEVIGNISSAASKELSIEQVHNARVSKHVHVHYISKLTLQ